MGLKQPYRSCALAVGSTLSIRFSRWKWKGRPSEPLLSDKQALPYLALFELEGDEIPESYHVGVTEIINIDS